MESLNPTEPDGGVSKASLEETLRFRPLESPFRLSRTLPGSNLSNLLGYIESLTMVERADRKMLKVLITHTTNPTLLEKIPTFDPFHLRTLAGLCHVGLRNLRSWPGRPCSLVNTPVSTRPPSPLGQSASPGTKVPGSPLKPANPSPNPSPTIQSSNSNLNPEHSVQKSSPVATPSGADVAGPIKPPDLLPARVRKQKAVQAKLHSARLKAAKKVLDELEIVVHLPELPPASKRPPEFGIACDERQGGRCMVSGGLLTSSTRQGCHLFPHSALHVDTYSNQITWIFLAAFLGEDLRNKLFDEICHKSFGVDTIANSIALLEPFHDLLDHGIYNLIPISISEDGRVMRMRYDFYGTSHQHIRHTFHPIDLKDAIAIDEDGYIERIYLEEDRYLVNGETLIATTSDLEMSPLPSSFLLFWREHLWCTLESASLSEKKDAALPEPPIYPDSPPPESATRKHGREDGGSKSEDPGDSDGDSTGGGDLHKGDSSKASQTKRMKGVSSKEESPDQPGPRRSARSQGKSRNPQLESGIGSGYDDDSEAEDEVSDNLEDTSSSATEAASESLCQEKEEEKEGKEEKEAKEGKEGKEEKEEKEEKERGGGNAERAFDRPSFLDLSDEETTRVMDELLAGYDDYP